MQNKVSQCVETDKNLELMTTNEPIIKCTKYKTAYFFLFLFFPLFICLLEQKSLTAHLQNQTPSVCSKNNNGIVNNTQFNGNFYLCKIWSFCPSALCLSRSLSFFLFSFCILFQQFCFGKNAKNAVVVFGFQLSPYVYGSEW